MTASLFLIAGLFDGPWVFIAVVIVSALANWLSKRRQEQAGGEEPPAKAPGETPPQASSDWEERLRRLLGEEIVPPPARPAPAASPAPPQTAAPRPPILRPAERRPASAMRPPPVEVAPVFVPATAAPVSGGVEETVRRFEQMDPAVMTPVRPIAGMGNRRGSVLGESLRQPRAARQAFITSLVFGPPKALED